MHQYDAAIIGSGLNELAAGIKIARAGYSVKIFEAKELAEDLILLEYLIQSS